MRIDSAMIKVTPVYGKWIARVVHFIVEKCLILKKERFESFNKNEEVKTDNTYVCAVAKNAK